MTLKDLAVTGRDSVELGGTLGKELGDTLNELLEKVIDAAGAATRRNTCVNMSEKAEKIAYHSPLPHTFNRVGIVWLQGGGYERV